MSEINLDQDEAAEAAKERGCTIVRGGPTTLLLDLDNSVAVQQYEALIKTVTDNLRNLGFELKEVERWESSNSSISNRRWHVKLKVTVLREGGVLSLRERLLIQACLGSDPLKEFLSFVRFKNGNNSPSLLFRPKPKKFKKTQPPAPPLRRKPLTEEYDEEVPF